MTSTEQQRVEEIAKGLTDLARMGLRHIDPTAHLMGGFYGLAWTDPTLVEKVGPTHPIFGAHYRLTNDGVAVRTHLKEQAS